MNIIETPSVAFNSCARLTVESLTTHPSVVLSADKASRNVNDVWVEDQSMKKQTVTGFYEGEPVELTGVIPDENACSVAGAHKVVLEVKMSSKNLPAFAAGKMSRSLVAISIHRIVEVWTTPTKCVYDANKSKAAIQVLSLETGKIGK